MSMGKAWLQHGLKLCSPPVCVENRAQPGVVFSALFKLWYMPPLRSLTESEQRRRSVPRGRGQGLRVERWKWRLCSAAQGDQAGGCRDNKRVFGDRYPSEARKSAESRFDWASRRGEPGAWPRSVSRAVLRCAEPGRGPEMHICVTTSLSHRWLNADNHRSPPQMNMTRDIQCKHTSRKREQFSQYFHANKRGFYSAELGPLTHPDEVSVICRYWTWLHCTRCHFTIHDFADWNVV